MIIAVGTTNEAKLRSVKEALNLINTKSQLFLNFELVGVSVPSNVDPQPLSEIETLNGAQNRAVGALNATTDAVLGIGIG